MPHASVDWPLSRRSTLAAVVCRLRIIVNCDELHCIYQSTDAPQNNDHKSPVFPADSCISAKGTYEWYYHVRCTTKVYHSCLLAQPVKQRVLSQSPQSNFNQHIQRHLSSCSQPLFTHIVLSSQEITSHACCTQTR